MFKNFKNKAKKSKSPSLRPNVAIGKTAMSLRGRGIAISDDEKRMTISSAGAIALLGETFSKISQNTPKSVVEAWIAFVEANAQTAATLAMMAVAASMATKKVIEPLIARLGIMAAPAEFQSTDGINFKGYAILGHAIMLVLGEKIRDQPGITSVYDAYKSSIGNKENIRQFSAMGVIESATGSKLTRQELLRTYAIMPWEDIDKASFISAFDGAKKHFKRLALTSGTAWVRTKNTGRGTSLLASLPSAPVPDTTLGLDLTDNAEYMKLGTDGRSSVDRLLEDLSKESAVITRTLKDVFPETKFDDYDEEELVDRAIETVTLYEECRPRNKFSLEDIPADLLGIAANLASTADVKEATARVALIGKNNTNGVVFRTLLMGALHMTDMSEES